MAMYGNLLRFPIVNFFFGKGYLGVDVFFFLSAYGLCYSFKNHSLKDFYVHRAKKLFPMYLLFLGILFVFFPASRGDNWGVVLLFQVTGLSTFLNIQIEWFIPALIVLYLIFPLLYKGIEKLYSMGPWWMFLLLAFVILIAGFAQEYINHLFALRFPIILLGIITYLTIREKDINVLIGIYTLSAFLGVLCSGISSLNGILSGSLCIPILLYSIGQLSFLKRELKIIPFVGEHTLEIYLAQCIVFNHLMASSKLSFIHSVLFAVILIPLITIVLYYTQHLFYLILRGRS